jgi:hypothetical protein
MNMATKAEFQDTFQKLKAILQPYAAKLIVAADTKHYYALETNHVMKNKHRLYFAGVKLGKAYVSYYLMPVYACPELLKSLSPELKKRMQGKACFNFKTVDEKLFKELAKLTRAGATEFKAPKFF